MTVLERILALKPLENTQSHRKYVGKSGIQVRINEKKGECICSVF